MAETPSTDHQDEVVASCTAGCPVHTDTREYVKCIAEGDYEQAMEILLDANPFSSVCGRICHHPCEQNCRRGRADAPVGLRMLKRFVMENTGDYRTSRRKRVEQTREEKVAVIGSGPAGLTAAHDLAKQGFPVTVFEKDDTPGGMLGKAIPRYRLPYEVLMEDIDDILGLGVELKTSCAVGKDITLADMRKDGYAAILISTGLSESRSLSIPGIDSDGVLMAIPFLDDVSHGNFPPLGDSVVVIGGGNVAIDVARCARRLGQPKVTLVSLESAEEMPAWEWEQEEGTDEGVEIQNSWGPKAIACEDGTATGIELKRCTAVFGADGRFSPQFDEDETTCLSASTIIVAIGQWSDLTCVEDSDVKTACGRLEYDRERMTTTGQGIFACGEVSTGPGGAVEAVRDGHRAARAIQHFLDTGESIQQPAKELVSLGEIPWKTIERIQKRPPILAELLPAESRVMSFSAVEEGYTEADALAEASRCMACATGAFVDEEKCAGCLTCVRVCPYEVATVDRTAIMPQEECQTCGLCAAACPAAAIALKRFETDRTRDRIAEILSGVKEDVELRPFVVAYCCQFAATSREFLQVPPDEASSTGVVRVMVPCVGRLNELDLLAPFELGVDGVAVVSCAEDGCLYPTAEERLEGHIKRVKEILDDIEVGGDKLHYLKTQITVEAPWSVIWEKIKGELQGTEVEA